MGELKAVTSPDAAPLLDPLAESTADLLKESSAFSSSAHNENQRALEKHIK